jgi:hypothetical protein
LWFGVVIALIWLQVQRQPGVSLLDSIWAEDGRVFLQDQLGSPITDTVARPYNGYMHLAPRAIALLVAHLPIENAAWWLTVSSAAAISLLASFVYHASAVLLPSPWQRATLVAFMVLPAVASETFGNVANLHWYLMFAAFWAVLFEPRTLGMTSAGVAVVVIAALSDPLTALLLPLALVVAYLRRSRRNFSVGSGLLLATALQGLVVLGANRPRGPFPDSVIDVAAIFGARVGGGLLLGDRFLGLIWLRIEWLLPLAGSMIIGIAVVLGLTRTQGQRRLAAVAATTYAIAFFLVPLSMRGIGAITLHSGQLMPLGLSRYMLIPSLLLLSVVLAGRKGMERSPTVPYDYILIAWIVIVVISNYPIVQRNNGPSWTEGLAAASEACSTSAVSASRVLISPRIMPSEESPWYVDLPCEVVHAP